MIEEINFFAPSKFFFFFKGSILGILKHLLLILAISQGRGKEQAWGSHGSSPGALPLLGWAGLLESGRVGGFDMEALQRRVRAVGTGQGPVGARPWGLDGLNQVACVGLGALSSWVLSPHPPY